MACESPKDSLDEVEAGKCLSLTRYGEVKGRRANQYISYTDMTSVMYSLIDDPEPRITCNVF